MLGIRRYLIRRYLHRVRSSKSAVRQAIVPCQWFQWYQWCLSSSSFGTAVPPGSLSGVAYAQEGHVGKDATGDERHQRASEAEKACSTTTHGGFGGRGRASGVLCDLLHGAYRGEEASFHRARPGAPRRRVRRVTHQCGSSCCHRVSASALFEVLSHPHPPPHPLVVQVIVRSSWVPQSVLSSRLLVLGL